MDVCVSADQVYMAKLAEQAERYDEMVKFMDSVVKDVIPEQELTVEERNLLSVAYKNVIGARRASWRIISSIEQKEESKGNVDNAERIKGYKTKVGGVVDIYVCVCVSVCVCLCLCVPAMLVNAWTASVHVYACVHLCHRIGSHPLLSV